MDNQKEILRKWYAQLQFSQKYDASFEGFLKNDSLRIRDTFSDNAAENFLSALYQCEKLEKKYIEKGIDLQIFRDTMKDVVVWTDIWYGLTGELGLMETGWLKNHLGMRLFRIGRLQYCFGKASMDVPALGMKKGEAIVEVHIPSGEPLQLEDCNKSIAAAKVFLAKYYPEYTYEFFTCHSWLLDETLHKLMEPGANILQFQTLFQVVEDEVSDAAIRYIFRWDAVREKVPQYEATSKLAVNVKDYVMKGGKLYQSYGIFRK